jgi:hypothetical protein
MTEMSAYTILVWKLEERTPLYGPKHGFEDNVKN